MKLIRIVKRNLISLLTYKSVFFISFVFISNFILTKNQFENEGSLLLLSFIGPVNLGFDVLKWLLIQLPYIVIIGEFFYRDITHRMIYIFPRIGNVKVWFTSAIVTIAIFVLIYYLLGFGITYTLFKLFGNVQNSKSILENFILFQEYTTVSLLYNLFSLLVLSSIILILINMIFTIFIGNSTVSFTLIMVFILISILINSTFPNLTKWWPVSQGVLAWHDFTYFTLYWSYVYLLLLLIILPFIYYFVFLSKMEKIICIER